LCHWWWANFGTGRFGCSGTIVFLAALLQGLCLCYAESFYREWEFL
jgi:hypothetical protein